jgi:ATP adenylyltransferase
MDHLFTPWRYAYITATDGAPRPGVPASLAAWPGNLNCVFCNLIASIDYAIANGTPVAEAEQAGGLIVRGQHCFICLNAYPYASGHVMAMPYAHLASLAALPVDAAHELMDLAQRTERVLAFASACAAAVGRRYELYDDGGGVAGVAGVAGSDVETDAGRV